MMLKHNRRFLPAPGTPIRLVTCALLSGAAPAAAQVMLPPPQPDPQTIDFASDPLLRFIGQSAPAAAFQARIAEAVAQHPASGEAEADNDSATAAARAARSALLPTLSVALVGARSLARDFEGNSAIVEGLVPRGRADASIAAEQLLFDFGAGGARVNAAVSRRQSARASGRARQTATALAAIDAWYQVLGFQVSLDLANGLIARHHRIVADTRARVAAGLSAAADVARAEAGLADATSAATAIDSRLARMRARYREAFGVAPPLYPAHPAAPASLATDPAAAMAMSQQAPEVVAARAAAAAARNDARAARADTLPQVTAGLSATRFNLFDSASNYDVRGTIALRQLLAVGGGPQARSAQAAAQARALGHAADAIASTAASEAEAGFADARILAANLPALTDAYRANRRARDATAEQFRQSRGSLIDLLRSEEAFHAAAQALLRGQLARDLAAYTLLARTGELAVWLDAAAGDSR
jgi:adhesin transport system outer membrane protein